MTHEAFEAVDLGQAEELIEIGMHITDEEMWLKFTPAATPYAEFE